MKPRSSRKPSDEERRKLKKQKPKSEKRKRRYSSSDSADSRKKKPRKLKESKKRSRKKSRHASTSSTSSSYSSGYSISSCSTCEKRRASRSRSPISRDNRKSKLRKSRVSTGSKYKGRERGRSHRRSRSCSTCSSSSTHSGKRSRSLSRSRSPSRSKRLRKEREKTENAKVSRRVEPGSEESDKVTPAYENVASPSRDEKNNMQGGTKESEPIGEVAQKDVPEKTQNDNTGKAGVVDVELILRQKALENFIKFHKFKKSSNGQEIEQPVSNEADKELGSAQAAMADDKEREEPIIDEPTEVISNSDLKGKEKIIAETSVRKPKIRSVITIPTERGISEDSTAIDPYEISESIKEMPKLVELGSKSNPNPNSSSPVVSCLSKSEQHERTRGGVETTGEQYEKKTFSRMHEGETVQVSYKVYIPKKASALARIKLQRDETSTSG